MEALKLLVDFIGTLIWPIVVMTIVLMFRKEIISRLKDIKKFEVPGFKAELFEQKIKSIVTESVLDVQEEIRAEDEQKSKIQSEKKMPSTTNLMQDTQKYSPAFDNTLLAFSVGDSQEENLKYGIYYDPATRNHNSPFKYIGLYTNKRIFAVGEVKNLAYCNWVDGKLIATNGDDLNKLTSNEYNRIKDTIENTDYYDLDTGHKFYLVDKFYPTNYVKKSDYPLRAKRYFWLEDVEGFKEGMSAEEIAALLNGKEWE